MRARRVLGGLARGIAFRHLFLLRPRLYGLVSAFVAIGVIGLQLLVEMALSGDLPG